MTSDPSQQDPDDDGRNFEPLRFRHQLDPSCFTPFAVEGVRTFGAKGIAPGAGQDESDPDWQAL